ncbi:hypothetical protein BDZ45DRAFT_585016 [Acephala macrosclerotiorum]|nr:hypothetical protein BDZ45DRAFT_585016 [Acephala macrosclerotiorum]
MGKKKTPEEKAKRARENGFNDDDDDIDDSLVLKEILEYTHGVYNEQMDMWRDILLNLLDFQYQEMPTVDTVRCYMRRFTSVWPRVTGGYIPEQFRRSLTHYIKGPLKVKIGLSTAHRERHYLTLKKYLILVFAVWENDWSEFDHEASRVGFSAKMNFYCYSSARIGELTESSARANSGKGLRYRDIIMLVGWGQDGKPEIRIALIREFAKGKHDSRNRSDLKTLCSDEIFDLQPPQYDDHWILEWADHMQDVPVFQGATCHGPTGKIQKSSSFSKQLTSAAQRAGMVNVTIHDGRREAIVKANARGYSIAELGKFAGQSNHRVFQTYYMAEGSVDGQNSFLNQPCRTDFIEDMRGISLHCNPELWQSLPAKMQHELQQRPDYIALQEEITSLNNNITTATDEETGRKLRARRKDLYTERQQLIKEELKKCRKSQPRKHSSQGNQGDRHRSFFNRVRHMMPERDRLARTLSLPFPLRSPEGRAALEDLIALYRGDSRVAYQPVLRPVLGCCPVPSCEQGIQRLVSPYSHVKPS